MGRKSNNVDASVTITFNGKQAEQVLAQLEKKAEKLRTKIAELEKAAVPDEKAITRLRKELNAVEKSIKSQVTQTKKYEETLKKLDKASIKELTAAQRALLAQIKQLTPGTKEFIAATEGYKKVTARINSLNAAYKQVDATQSNIFRRVASGMNRYFLMASAAIASITGVSARLKDAARQAAELDDAYAQVMKTTGLTHQQVEELNEAFKKMDTRTARMELNRLAYEAGKLGFNTVESVQQFVEAADIINVALGDVLGEGATLEIAKLASVYSKSTDLIESKDLKGKMLAVGSAINQLGKESTASESYMVDFLGRLGGVSVQADIAVDQILGYASALDQMKQKVEMSATAFQKLIQQMIKKPEEFVQAARMPLEDFKKLMETDMNGAIMRVLEGFNEMSGFTQLIPVFKDMGLDGARAASVIASLASNLDLVSEAQATANEHLKLGTSMMNEYNIMNGSLQAQLEKSRKDFKEATYSLGQSLNPALLKSTKAITYIIKALVAYGKEIKAVIIALAALTIAVKAQAIAQGIKTAAMKIGNAVTATGTVLSNKMMAAYYGLTGQTLKLAAAQNAANAAMSKSVFGVVAIMVSALAVAVSKYISKQREANKELDYFENIEKKIADAQADEISKIQSLNKLVHDNNNSYMDRKKALKELQEIVPDYHASLTKEGELIEDNTTAIDKYIEALRASIRMNILKEELTEIERQIIDAQNRVDAAYKKYAEKMDNGNMNRLSNPVGFWNMPTADESLASQFWTDYQAEKAALKALEEQENKLLGIINNVSKETAKVRTGIVEGGKEDFKKAMSDLELQQQKELNALKEAYMQKMISQEEYQKKSELLNIDFLKQKQELAKDYGEDETKYVSAWLDAVIKANERVEKEWAAFEKEIENAELERLKNSQKAFEKRQKEKEDALKKEMQTLRELNRVAESWRNEFADPWDEYESELAMLETLKERELLTEEEYLKAVRVLNNEYAEKINEDLEKNKDLGVLAKYNKEKEALRKLLIDGEMSWLDYEKAVSKLRLEYAAKTAEAISSTLNKIGSLISSLRDMEMAQAEAQYQADLTAAGDNAEERERVENEYQQKQLDIKKKYADVDMAINISKAIAEGALAVARAFADMPYPAAIVVSALIAATTAAQVATIVAQRNAIKNSSVNTSGSTSTGNQNYGDRVITGYKQGGYTDPNADEDEIVGVTHGQEYVIPKWLVKRERVMVRNLEEYRKTGHRPKAFSGNGFADGGYTTPPTNAGSGSDQKMMDSLNKLEKAINKMVDEGVPSFMSYKQFNDFINQHNRFKKITSRKS
ncbi:MAG: phage tail tape measure protein [Bacteroidales bacterium]|nr:phage tail tape measure protein [Bacteroidales bacterium]